jgi:hypothetical protein
MQLQAVDGCIQFPRKGWHIRFAISKYFVTSIESMKGAIHPQEFRQLRHNEMKLKKLVTFQKNCKLAPRNGIDSGLPCVLPKNCPRHKPHARSSYENEGKQGASGREGVNEVGCSQERTTELGTSTS